ncbi:N-6 DNA methylase [Kushneria sp. TE3]|uniref:N-6 DNA methylase n=1 Tax=Kushneria sp. TE3 TaxID=3449832 RepID=UPI003F684C0B
MNEALVAAGSSLSMPPDLLEMSCTGRTVQDLQDMVATLEWLDAGSLIAALAGLVEQAPGQHADQFPLPLPLAELMARLGRANGQQLVASGPMSDLPMALADEAVERTYASASHSALSEALILISGAMMVTQAQGTTAPQTDVVLSVPPMGVRIPDTGSAGKQRSRRSEAVGLQEAHELATRRAVVLGPASLLFDKTEYALRETLVRDDSIDMVIQLPAQTLWGTSIPPVLIVLDHQRKLGAPITFIDAARLLPDTSRQRLKPLHQNPDFWEALSQVIASDSLSGEASRHISQNEIESNDFDLSVHRYIAGDATQKISDLEEARSLSEVAEIVRAQTLKGEEGDDGRLFIEIGGRDINASGQIHIEEPYKEVMVAGHARKRAEQQQLRPGDVLLIGKGSIGRVALVGEDCGENWVAGQVFLIIRAQKRGRVRPEYLYRYLASPMVQQYLKEIASGTSIPVLKANDIKHLPVPAPSLEAQGQVVDVHRQIMEEYEAIKAHQAKIEALSQQYWAI